MADRDALIAICWFAIVLMIFFECFYRRMKRRFQRDVQPNQGNEADESLLESGSQVGGNQEVTRTSRHSATNFFRTGRFTDAAPNYNQVIARSSNYPPLPPSMLPRQQQIERLRAMEGVEGSISYSTTITMDLIDEEEEPPPTYDEAMTFARLVKKFRLTPYGFYMDTATTQLPPPQITDPPDAILEVNNENESSRFLGHSPDSLEFYIGSGSDSVFEDDAGDEENGDEEGNATEYENDHLHENMPDTKDWNNNANGSQQDLARIDCDINSTRNLEVPAKDPNIFVNDKKVEVAVGVSADVELEHPKTII